jgi:hypothetical protein
MAFSPCGLAIAAMLGRRSGITDPSRLTQLEIVGGLFGCSPTGLVLTSVLAQRSNPSSVSSTTQPSGTVPAPDVRKMTVPEAVDKLRANNLTDYQYQLKATPGPDTGKVLFQDPAPGTPLAPKTQVKLAYI